MDDDDVVTVVDNDDVRDGGGCGGFLPDGEEKALSDFEQKALRRRAPDCEGVGSSRIKDLRSSDQGRWWLPRLVR